ncbi:hypothetical protein JTE90_017203 [Oedothorax gibbosus]|uniref:Uncharacterized protein n=1 Tax=Oedothorax gibbosus TaxID=931172 RepID=A0AAV6VAG9_9ARAC|nr:hypothetical protein JTE90_017203 [Oedothorax gibbosus]
MPTEGRPGMPVAEEGASCPPDIRPPREEPPPRPGEMPPGARLPLESAENKEGDVEMLEILEVAHGLSNLKIPIEILEGSQRA